MIDDFLHALDLQTGLYRAMLETREPARLRELLAEIGTLDERVAPVRRRWNEIAPGLDAESAGRAGRSIAAARDVLARLVDRYAPAGRMGEAYGS